MKKSDTPKIMLYVDRTMGEKVNATFDFIKENWRVWLKFMFYGLMPLCIIQGIQFDGAISKLINNRYDNPFGDALEIFWLVPVGMVLVWSIVMALLKKYQERPNRLRDIKVRELWPLLWKNALRMVGVGLLSTVIAVPVMIVGFVLFFLPFIAQILAFGLILPLALWPVIYFYENDATYSSSFSKAWRLGFSKWIHLLYLGIVMVLLIHVLQGVVAIPWMVLEIVFSELFGGSGFVGAVFDVISNAIAVSYFFMVYVGMSFMALAFAFHYGSVASTQESASLDSEIDNFENL